MLMGALKVGGGGGSSVKSGTFEVTSSGAIQTGSTFDIETGIASPKCLVIIKHDGDGSYPQMTSMSMWRDTDSGYYVNSSTYTNAVVRKQIGDAQTVNDIIAIGTPDASGKFTCKVTGGGSYATYVRGTYFWYAE